MQSKQWSRVEEKNNMAGSVQEQWLQIYDPHFWNRCGLTWCGLNTDTTEVKIEH